MYNICSKFSHTFTEEIEKLKHKCNHKFLDRSTYVKDSLMSFRFMKVDSRCIEKIIDELKCNKAAGCDQVRVQDLKYKKKDLSAVLAKFINMCIKEGSYPELLKKALIRPIFKQGCHLDFTNYRPVAILSVVNKIVEKVIVGQISKYLEKHNIISNCQHGFRRGRSTITALTVFTDYVNNELEKGNQVLALFIDFKKAFDTLDHCQLMKAMEECGIRGPSHRFFSSYLRGRTLRTVVAGVTGEEAQVTLGVPTGSVYGPVGYIMHVNSMANVIRHSLVCMYADDTCLLVAGKDVQRIRQQLEEDFEMVTKWAHDNGIIINTDKTKCMHIFSPQNVKAKVVNKNEIKILGHSYVCLHNNKRNCNCKTLEYVESFKYLGLLIDSRFNWKQHINMVCNRLRSILGKFYHLKRILDKKTLFMVYYALVESIINYGLSCYGLSFNTYVEQIKKLQIRFLKYIVDNKVKTKCKDNYNKLFKYCRILPIEKTTYYNLALETYFKDEYKIKVSHKVITRSISKKKLSQIKAKNYYGQRTRKYTIPKLYNKYPILLEDSYICKEQLKKKLKECMLVL